MSGPLTRPRPYSGHARFADRPRVWGGRLDGGRSAPDGAVYLPRTDRWRPIAPAPIASRRGFSAVWSGQSLLVWGGCCEGTAQHDDGAVYAPSG